MRHRIGLFLAACGLLFITITTLIPLPEQTAASRDTSLWCLVCGEHGGVDVLDNLLLFIPLTAGLTLLGRRRRWVVLAGFLLSLSIESLQYRVIPGRDSSLSDLLTNTTGAWLGAVLAGHYRQLLWPSSWRAGRLALTWVLLWWAIQTATAVLLRPWSPHEVLRAAWTRVIPGRDTFDGTLTSALVFGRSVPDDTSALDSGIGQRIRSGSVDLELGLVSGRDLGSWSPVFELLGHSGPVLAVETRGPDLIVRMPSRAQAWRLRSPALKLAHALPPGPGVSLLLQAGEQGDTLWARWSSGTVRHHARQILSPSLGWSLIIPFHYAYGYEVPWLTGLWVAGWLIPLGYWWIRAGLGRSAVPWSILVLLVGLGFLPHLMGYPAVPWWEWLAGATGITVGWAGGYCAT
jgi:VanZ like family